MHPSMTARKNLKKRAITDIFIIDSGNQPKTMAQNSNEPHVSSEEYFIAQETFRLFACSWNVGGISPPDDLNLEDLLDIQNSIADIYVFGFQEIVPLKAGNILAPVNGDISMRWNSLIKDALNKRTTEDDLNKAEVEDKQRTYSSKPHTSTNAAASEFECIYSKQMVGIYITIWVRRELQEYISHLGISCIGCGIFGCLGNKGSVSIRFFLHETSFCFVCTHLASGGKDSDHRQRNTNVEHILARTLFPEKPFQHLPRKILDHERVIWLGDLNYRIYLPEATTRYLVKNKEWSILLEYDQLKAELNGGVFEGWHEKEIEFAPTYKYDINSDEYYGTDHKIKAAKTRAPAWCDRIIWFGNGLKQIHYNRVESSFSDHRPVRATFVAYVEESSVLKESSRYPSSASIDSSNCFTSSISN